jgi:hypothetical protein
MCVRLAHEKEMAQIVVLTAQIADNDTRGHSSQSHQSSETGGVVSAKPDAPMKQKFLQIVLCEFAWRQRIAKTLRPEKLECAVYYSARIGSLCGPGLCKLAHGGTDRWRKLERFLSFIRRQLFSSGLER